MLEFKSRTSARYIRDLKIKKKPSNFLSEAMSCVKLPCDLFAPYTGTSAIRFPSKFRMSKVSSSLAYEGATNARIRGADSGIFRMGNERLKYEALTREPVWITAGLREKRLAISGGITCPGNLEIKSCEVYRYAEESLCLSVKLR